MPRLRRESIYIRFQFLIGRLKTVVAIGEMDEILKFQFLIGRLKTAFVSAVYPNIDIVSIPHR